MIPKYTVARGNIVYSTDRVRFAIQAEDDGKYYWSTHDDYHLRVLQQMPDIPINKEWPLTEQEVKEVQDALLEWQRRKDDMK